MDISAKHVESLSELLQELHKAPGAIANNQWIYRGQANESWALKPSLERRIPNESIRYSESQLLGDFKKVARSLPYKLPDFDDTPSWLALMRHHAVPTRLLDWTYSSYVSLYFACANENSNQSNRTIWAVNSSALSQQSTTLSLKLIPEDEKRKELNLFLSKNLDLSNPIQFEAFAWYVFDEENKCNHKIGLVSELSPRWSNLRMSFQQGTFLVNCNHKLGFFESLQAMMSEIPQKNWLRKLTFPDELRPEILKYLYNTNIHPFTLFPDLDGLGSLLNLKNEIYWSR